MGTRNIMRNGVVIEMTAITDKQLKKFPMNVRNVSGILFSVDSISLLKRFSIRPTGVDSKNDIPLRNIEYNSESWNFFDVFKLMLAKNISAINMNMPVKVK